MSFIIEELLSAERIVTVSSTHPRPWLVYLIFCCSQLDSHNAIPSVSILLRLVSRFHTFSLLSDLSEEFYRGFWLASPTSIGEMLANAFSLFHSVVSRPVPVLVHPVGHRFWFLKLTLEVASHVFLDHLLLSPRLTQFVVRLVVGAVLISDPCLI